MMRRYNRLLVLFFVASDAVIIPLLLYAAITLRLGTFQHGIAGEGWLYLLVVGTAVPVFAKLGLYRAVVRYAGDKAMTAALAAKPAIMPIRLLSWASTRDPLIRWKVSVLVTTSTLSAPRVLLMASATPATLSTLSTASARVTS